MRTRAPNPRSPGRNWQLRVSCGPGTVPAVKLAAEDWEAFQTASVELIDLLLMTAIPRTKLTARTAIPITKRARCLVERGFLHIFTVVRGTGISGKYWNVVLSLTCRIGGTSAKD